MAWPCLEESDQCISEKGWVASSCGNEKKGRGRLKITLLEVIIKDMSIKEVTKSMTSDII